MVSAESSPWTVEAEAIINPESGKSLAAGVSQTTERLSRKTLHPGNFSVVTSPQFC